MEHLDQVSKIVFFENRCQVDHFNNSLGILDLIPLERSDHICGDCLETVLFVRVGYGELQPIACSRIHDVVRIVLRLQKTEAASQLRCIAETRIWFRWFKRDGRRSYISWEDV